MESTLQSESGVESKSKLSLVMLCLFVCLFVYLQLTLSVSHHFLNLIEALQECNSTPLPKVSLRGLANVPTTVFLSLDLCQYLSYKHRERMGLGEFGGNQILA